MSEFIWQHHYRIGNQKVDQQHQQLFDLANQLVQSKNQADLAENAKLLYLHVKEHFQYEEAFMKNHRYPEYQKHATAHQQMLDKLADVGDKINRHEWQQDDVLKFMRDWIGHTMEDDAVFNAYLQTQASRQSAEVLISEALADQQRGEC